MNTPSRRSLLDTPRSCPSIPRSEPEQVVVAEQRDEGQRREGDERVVQPPEETPVPALPRERRVDDHAHREGGDGERQRQGGDEERRVAEEQGLGRVR